MENKMKHLELIQGIINRMSSNSFMLKGWAVTLVAGIFAISTKDADKIYFLVAYIPVLVFWLLDAYYLKQEHLFIRLYDDVRLKQEKDIDFSLSSANCELKDCSEYIKCILSKTEIVFYLPLALLCTGVIIISQY